MRIIIRFKSGFELPITCDNFSITTHVMSGEITGYDIKGIKDNKLIFFRPEDVECIYRDMTAMDGERIEKEDIEQAIKTQAEFEKLYKEVEPMIFGDS